MKTAVFIASLLVSAAAVAGHGAGGGPPSSMGGSSMGHSSTGIEHSSMGSQSGSTNNSAERPAQQPLRDAQINGGAFRMLEKKTGMTSDELKALYASSGVKNFGEFMSALVVSKNLGLDSQAVFNGLKTQSLGKTLKSLGVEPANAKDEIRRAGQEIQAAG